ncbi:MAG: hypothetical protein ABSC94_21870 [Polyangiaceae bacterium]|jgi:hypothetical protein
MSSDDRAIATIEGLARRAERRIRWVRALRSGSRALCAALGIAIVDVALRKVGVVGEVPARVVLGAAAVFVVASSTAAWAWRLPQRAGAHALDRFHGLHDRLASALSFAALPASRRTAFMEAAIEDAVAVAPRASPAHAVPIVLPGALARAAGLALTLTGVMLLEVRTHIPVARAPAIDPIEMSPDDLDEVKDFLKHAEQAGSSDEAKAAIEEFNKLVDDIASKRLDRTEAFRRMEELEEKLLTPEASDRKALESQLEAMGDELKKAELARTTGEALADQRLAAARDAMQDLARKLRDPGAPVDKAKLEQLREALKRAAERADKARTGLERKREELADEILKMKQKLGDAGSEEEESLLRRKEQELERLDRDLAGQRNAKSKLDRLDRELEQAAEDLMKDLGASADDMEQSAEDLNRMDQQQSSQREKEELRQKLQELRQLMRQQGQSGHAEVARLVRFGRMARGQTGQGQVQTGQGDKDQNPGDSKESGRGKDGRGGSQAGQGRGSGDSSGAGHDGEIWIIGPNGEKVLMLSKRQGDGATGAAQGNGGETPHEGRPGQWGEGHDPKVQGKSTNPKMGTQDTEVQGADSAQGTTRSQAILGAAGRGFATRGYERVYTEYHQVAEESLAKDNIPGGYRFYVKRYFELIRPRDNP